MLKRDLEDLYKTFSSEMRRARLRRGLTMEELAREVQLSHVAIYKIEHGFGASHFHNIIAIAIALNMTGFMLNIVQKTVPQIEASESSFS